MSKQIFKGIRVLDFCQVIAGSYGTTILGDFGAEIIKIEPPGIGDSLRLAGPLKNGESGFFMLVNRNKKSICVDIKTKEGKQLIYDLVPHCDVVTQNFKPGVLEKLGFGYDKMREIKEDIIYSCVSGYGYNNQYSTRPAYDNMVQSETGLAAQNGFVENGRPLRSALSIADYSAGMYSGMAIMAAIYHHSKTGEGQFIDVAMYDSLISMMDSSFMIYDLNGEDIKATKGNIEKKNKALEDLGLKSLGNRHPSAAPHNFYKTKDGYVAHMSLTNSMWHKLAKLLNREDLIDDPKYNNMKKRLSHWKEIDEIIENWTTKLTSQELMDIFRANNLPYGKVRTIDEVCEDPQSKERGIFTEIEHPTAGKMKITSMPIKYSKTPAQIKTGSPLLGQHNDEILGDLLGYSEEKVNELRTKKAIYDN